MTYGRWPEKLSKGVDEYHARDNPPRPHPRKKYFESHCHPNTVKRINNPSNFKYLPPYFTNG